MTEAARRPRSQLGAGRALGLSFATVAATLALTVGVEAAAARAWTWVQLAAAALALSAALGLACAVGERRGPRRIALGLALVAALRVAWSAAPRSPRENPGALVATRFVSGEARRLWFSGVPERETMRLGALIGLSPEERRDDFAAIDSAYASIESDPTLFQRDESVLLDSWLFDREHFWLALPASRARPLPLIVFLHGHGGSFEMYPALLARGAVARGFAIAFAANGLGFWGRASDAGRVERIVDAVAREVPIDRARVSLVGLSAGGPGVFGPAIAAPGRYRSLVAISALMPDLEQSEALRGARVLILHGTEDPRAPIEAARRARDQLVRAGVPVELREEKRDHLALLTDPTWVPSVLDWLARD